MKLPDNFKKSTTVIHETTDYDKFIIPSYQRKVSLSRRKRTVASYLKHKSFSIGLVNEHYHLIDGHGRLEAARKLGIPFTFVIIVGAGVKDFIALNCSHVNLQLKDYEAIYSDAGIKDYQTFEAMRAKYGFSISSIIKIAYIALGGGNYTDFFRNGDFKFKDYKTSCKLADHIKSFGMQYGSAINTTYFVEAVIILWNRDSYDPIKMEKKASKHGLLFPLEATDRVYIINQLEKLYNHK